MTKQTRIGSRQVLKNYLERVEQLRDCNDLRWNGEMGHRWNKLAGGEEDKHAQLELGDPGILET